MTQTIRLPLALAAALLVVLVIAALHMLHVPVLSITGNVWDLPPL